MKVFYITTFGNNVFYVRAASADEAIAHLIEQVKKYYFKNDLAGNEAHVPPKTLGKNVIVEFGMHRGILEEEGKITAEDITAAAYIFSSAGHDGWADWELSTADVLIDP